MTNKFFLFDKQIFSPPTYFFRIFPLFPKNKFFLTFCIFSILFARNLRISHFLILSKFFAYWFYFFILNIWRFQKISKIFVTLVLRRILMRVKRQLQNEFFSILVSITKSVKLTMVKGQWTGWNKKKNAVLRLLLRRLQLLGRV